MKRVIGKKCKNVLTVYGHEGTRGSSPGNCILSKKNLQIQMYLRNADIFENKELINCRMQCIFNLN